MRGGITFPLSLIKTIFPRFWDHWRTHTTFMPPHPPPPPQQQAEDSLLKRQTHTYTRRYQPALLIWPLWHPRLHFSAAAIFWVRWSLNIFLQVELSTSALDMISSVTLHDQFVPSLQTSLKKRFSELDPPRIECYNYRMGSNPYSSINCTFPAPDFGDTNKIVQVRVWDSRKLLMAFSNVTLVKPSEKACREFGTEHFYCNSSKACVGNCESMCMPTDGRSRNTIPMHFVCQDWPCLSDEVCSRSPKQPFALSAGCFRAPQTNMGTHLFAADRSFA